MASYLEIVAIYTHSVSGAQDLENEIGVACQIAAELIISGGDTSAPFDQTAGAHDQRILWVLQLLANPKSITRQMFYVVVAANNSATQANILGATDSAIQSNVNASIDALAANLQ